MPYSYAVYTGNGATTQFSIPFSYIRKEHVKVYVNFVDTAYTYVNNTTVQLATAPANGARVEVRRVTPATTPLVDFTDGSTLVAADLDTSNLQHLYLEQELDDALKQTVSIDPTTGLPSAGGQRITNVGDPTGAQDAATKSWVENSTSAPLVQFRSLFYGAFPTDQATDPYGNAPTVGDQYFNTTSNVMRVWNGANWQDASSNANVLRWRKTAVGGETSLTGTDDNGATLTYTVNLEFVYLNGALLARGQDYTATNGTGITGLTALTAGDVVEVLSYSSFNLVNIPSNTITFTQAGTGAVTRTVDGKLKDVVSVKDFGAVGDGVTDDTAAIQAAIVHCETTGKKLFIPIGDYLCGSLDITANPGITIEGEASAAHPGPLAGKGGGVRFFYTGSGDFLRINVGTPSTTYIYRIFLSNFTILFNQNTVNSAINLHNVQESIFKNITVIGKSTGAIPNDVPSQSIGAAFLLDSAGITEFNTCITSYVPTIYKCTGQVGGQITGSLNIYNGNHYRVTNFFTGGSIYYAVNVFKNWVEGFQNAFLFDTNQAYNGISTGIINISENTFFQSTPGITNPRVINVLSTDNTLPINFYVNFTNNFCQLCPIGGTPSNYAISLAVASNTSTVNGLLNCKNNVFWVQFVAALTTDTNAIRIAAENNDVRAGIYGSGVLPFSLPGLAVARSSSTIASEAADFSAFNSTTEVVLKSISIPTDLFVPGFVLDLSLLCTYISSANNKTIRVRIGGLAGTVIATYTNTAIAVSRMDVSMAVTGSSTLRCAATQDADPATSSAAIQYNVASIPASPMQVITITGQVANAGDNVALNWYKLTMA